MKRFFFVSLFVIFTLFAFVPLRVNAVDLSSLTIVNTGNKVVYIMDNCNTALLGNPNDPNSVAWLLQQALNVIRVVGPILVIILSSFDFIRVIINNDDEAMGKAQKKLVMRLVLVALLFFIPTLVEVLLRIFNLTSTATCGIQ